MSPVSRIDRFALALQFRNQWGVFRFFSLFLAFFKDR